MNLQFRKVLVIAAALAATVSARAVPTLIDTLDVSNFPPFGDANVQAGINDAIADWNLAYDPDLPTTGIGATPNVKLNQGDVVSGYPTFGADTLSIVLPMGDYNYLFLHWGGPNSDANYLNPQLYYIGGEVGSLIFDAPVHHIPAELFTSGPKAGQIKKEAEDKQYGLSFYSFYSEIPDSTGTPITVPQVPDQGTPMALLGLGLAGLGLTRRVMARR